MRLPKYLSSTSFRIAVAYAGLFAASVVVLFSMAYSLISGEMEQQIRVGVEQEARLLDRAYHEGGLSHLTDMLADRTAPGGRPDSVYLLQDSTGAVIAGNLPSMTPFAGWRELEIQRPSGRHGTIKAENIVAVGSQLTDGSLVVGGSLRNVSEVQRHLLRTLNWTLGLTVLLALTGGIVMGRAALRRVEAISRATCDIIRGNLSRRVPVRGCGDELDELAVNINHMLARIEVLMGNLRQVTNDIAHDLRTPLGRLRQRLEKARNRAGQCEEECENLDTAIEETDAILQTFAALLRIAEVEAGARKQRFADVDLSGLAETIVEAYETVAEDNGQKLTAAIDAGLGCRGDRDLLTQMLANLVENAIRHTPSGTAIGITVARVAEGILVAVGDNGLGVHTADRDKIFRRLYRTQQSRTTPGTGLGLSLVKVIAELHEATVAAHDNQPGLRVEVSFPVAAVPGGRVIV
jgi:signal transduction histidine kinase